MMTPPVDFNQTYGVHFFEPIPGLPRLEFRILFHLILTFAGVTAVKDLAQPFDNT